MSGFFNKYIVPTRPLLVVALLLSAYLFVYRQVEAPAEISQPLTAEQDAQTTEPEGDPSDAPTSDALLPTESLIASLFGSDSIDPFFTLPEIAPIGEPSVQEDPIVAPEEEPARSIYYYLVAASDIGFEANPSRLGLALATAEQGEVDALNNLIADFEVRLVDYGGLLPPTDLEQVHAESLALLERYVAHMRNSRDRIDGSVEATWNNAERDVIAEEATRINEEIREIVHNYNILLPVGVLP